MRLKYTCKLGTYIIKGFEFLIYVVVDMKKHMGEGIRAKPFPILCLLHEEMLLTLFPSLEPLLYLPSSIFYISCFPLQFLQTHHHEFTYIYQNTNVNYYSVPI